MKKWLIILILIVIGYYVSQNAGKWKEKFHSVVFEENNKTNEENPSSSYKTSIDKLKSLKEEDKNQSETSNVNEEKPKDKEKETEKKAEEEIRKLVGVQPPEKEESFIEKVEKFIKMIKEKIFGGNK
jgi:pyruvate/2-oxoacid:ferredoxin oxidoreductase beta subunit